MATLKQLSVKVSFEQQPDKEIALAGFLFLCNGQFLQRQAVRDNMLQFNFAKTETADFASTFDSNELRLFIVPITDLKLEKITVMEDLESYKPYEPILSANANGEVSILPLPVNITRFWPFCNCRVTGKVSKWFHIGNTWKQKAVCRARVHICEIDAIRYWIYQIPDTIIARIPDVILRPEEIFKVPIPVPGPSPFLRSSRAIAATPQGNIFKSASSDQLLMEAASRLPELNFDIRQNFASGNINLIRETIINNYVQLHPWFCLWPVFWPWLYRCNELAVVYTNATGRFDTNVSYRCFGDKPDIYIWVEYYINGAWTVVYNPPIPCNTLWDYACGSNISINVTDPRVPGDCCCNCGIPGELVWVRSIGSANVIHINQDPLPLAPDGQLQAFDRIGLSNFLTTPADYRRPFGSTISFYMGFGSDLPNAGIFYYRWRYKKTKAADLTDVSGSVEYLNTLLKKEYSYEINVGGDIIPSHDNVKIGPQDPVGLGATQNLYIIPPPLPSGAPFNIASQNPEWYERTHNTTTISFNSADLMSNGVTGGDGLYEFTLELFNQAGELLTNLPRNTFKVSDVADEDNGIPAPDKLLVNPNAATADAFKMLVRIDNAVCNSKIFPVNADGNPASVDCCGFVKYKHPDGSEADLDLSFLASHPNNLATFSFNVVKGTCGDVAGAGAGGVVIDSANGYLLTSGIYKKHFTPSALLGACYAGGTGKAAFAETLTVETLATNGYTRVYAYDAPCIVGLENHCVAAFALEP